MTNTNDPELLRLAQLAVERMDIEREMRSKMCPACLKAYDEAWAKTMANRMVAIGESEYGKVKVQP